MLNYEIIQTYITMFGNLSIFISDEYTKIFNHLVKVSTAY